MILLDLVPQIHNCCQNRKLVHNAVFHIKYKLKPIANKYLYVSISLYDVGRDSLLYFYVVIDLFADEMKKKRIKKNSFYACNERTFSRMEMTDTFFCFLNK